MESTITALCALAPAGVQSSKVAMASSPTRATLKDWTADRRKERYRAALAESREDSDLDVLGSVDDDLGQALAEILDHLEAQGTRLPAESFRKTWAKVLAVKAEIPKT